MSLNFMGSNHTIYHLLKDMFTFLQACLKAKTVSNHILSPGCCFKTNLKKTYVNLSTFTCPLTISSVSVSSDFLHCNT